MKPPSQSPAPDLDLFSQPPAVPARATSSAPSHASGVPGVPYARGSDTSAAAAARVGRRTKTRDDEQRALRWIASRMQGATDHELQAHFGWSGDYGRPRRWTLEKAGFVERSPSITRPTPSGSSAHAYFVTGFGRRELARLDAERAA